MILFVKDDCKYCQAAFDQLSVLQLIAKENGEEFLRKALSFSGYIDKKTTVDFLAALAAQDDEFPVLMTDDKRVLTKKEMSDEYGVVFKHED